MNLNLGGLVGTPNGTVGVVGGMVGTPDAPKKAIGRLVGTHEERGRGIGGLVGTAERSYNIEKAGWKATDKQCLPNGTTKRPKLHIAIAAADVTC